LRFEIKGITFHGNISGFFLGSVIAILLSLSACAPSISLIAVTDVVVNVPTTVLTPTATRIPVQPTSTPVATLTPTSRTTSFNSSLTSTPLPTVRPSVQLFPDAELVYSPTSIDFDTSNYLQELDGYLSGYRQYLMITGWTSAADIISRVAWENSINPRLLLALLEYLALSPVGISVEQCTGAAVRS